MKEKNKFIIGAKNEEAHKNQEKEQLNNNSNKQKIQKKKGKDNTITANLTIKIML